MFIVIAGLAIGAILVYAKNNMSNTNTNVAAENSSQFSQNLNPQNTGNAQGQVQGQQTQIQGQTQTQGQQAQDLPQGQAQTQQPKSQQNASAPTMPPGPTGPVTELEIKDEVVGTGAEVKNGDSVEVNYLGTFLDGRKFDSSYDRNQTFNFTVGAGSVIKGWDTGLVGMKVGGKRILVIPADMAYGEMGSPGAIPPNTPLMFQIELVSIK